MKWLLRLIPVLLLIAVLRKGSRLAAKRCREERDLEQATL